MECAVFLASPWIEENAGIELVLEHPLDLLLEDPPPGPCPKPRSVQRVRQRCDRVLSAGEVLQALLDNGEALTVRLVRARLAPIRKPLRMNVAEGRHPAPNPFKNSTLHAGLASRFPKVVFDLR